MGKGPDTNSPSAKMKKARGAACIAVPCAFTYVIQAVAQKYRAYPQLTHVCILSQRLIYIPVTRDIPTQGQ